MSNTAKKLPRDRISFLLRQVRANSLPRIEDNQEHFLKRVQRDFSTADSQKKSFRLELTRPTSWAKKFLAPFARRTKTSKAKSWKAFKRGGDQLLCLVHPETVEIFLLRYVNCHCGARLRLFLCIRSTIAEDPALPSAFHEQFATQRCSSLENAVFFFDCPREVARSWPVSRIFVYVKVPHTCSPPEVPEFSRLAQDINVDIEHPPEPIAESPLPTSPSDDITALVEAPSSPSSVSCDSPCVKMTETPHDEEPLCSETDLDAHLDSSELLLPSQFFFANQPIPQNPIEADSIHALLEECSPPAQKRRRLVSSDSARWQPSI